MHGTQHQNGAQSNGSTPAPGQQPRDELDMYSQILQSSGSNPLLRDTNLGQGNYDETYLWQQVRSYRKGLYAYIAFSGVLSKRAIYETKIRLAREGFTHYNEADQEPQQWDALDEDDVDDGESFWTAQRRRGDEIWSKLADNRHALSEKQAAAILEKTDISDEFMPVFWQMVSGRHEVSRSQDAELLRDMLTGIKHLRSDDGGDVAGLLEEA